LKPARHRDLNVLFEILYDCVKARFDFFFSHPVPGTDNPRNN